MDRISDLPDEVKAKILSFLPIKEAVKTSRLSSKWRYTWASISHLNIHENYFSSRKLPENRSRLVKFLDILFLLHQGPIWDFKLSTKQFCADALDRWIVILSRNEIQKIDFEFSFKRKYKLPISFYSCEKLNSINLSNCSVKLPQQFKGFNLLTTLKLENCSFSGPHIEKLISNCPILNDLSLIKFREKISLKINSPKLEKLSIEGIFTDLQLNTPNLIKSCIDLETMQTNRYKNGPKCNFGKVFGGFQNIKMLGIHGHFLLYLAQGVIKDHVNLSFLKRIVMDINLNDSKEFEMALYLFQNAPKLEDLDISVNGTSEEKNKSITMHNTFLRHMKRVKISCFVFSEPVIEFARFILASSPILEKLCILKEKPDFEHIEYNMTCNKIETFARASNNVLIMFAKNSFSPSLFSDV